MSDPETKDDTVRTIPSPAGHTPTPWAYRPQRFDDWGWIRGPRDEGDAIEPIVATTRSGHYETEAALDKHRDARTDPYGANAAFIIGAVNSLDEILITMKHARVFISSREKMHPEGIRQYDELFERIRDLVGSPPDERGGK